RLREVGPRSDPTLRVEGSVPAEPFHATYGATAAQLELGPRRDISFTRRAAPRAEQSSPPAAPAGSSRLAPQRSAPAPRPHRQGGQSAPRRRAGSSCSG